MTAFARFLFTRIIIMSLILIAGFSSVQLTAKEACHIDMYREMLIVDRPVVEDKTRVLPGGAWHMSSLFRQMLPKDASDADVSRLIIQWLNQWEETTEVNGFPVATRDSVKNLILCPWLNASNNRRDCKGDQLDLDLAPFRLLAIVNRMDKYQKGDPNAGEGRFVFGALAKPTKNPLDTTNSPINFTVILEYSLPISETVTVDTWAKEWHRLGQANMSCLNTRGCDAYRKQLNILTNAFSNRDTASGKPNGNPLNQIRTNEFLYGSTTWELRQFELKGDDRHATLESAPLQQTPDQSLNDSNTLRQFILGSKGEVLNGTFKIPQKYLGGAISQSLDEEFKWKFGPGVSEDLRFSFSKATCNGCHREENRRIPSLDGFFHISPHRSPGLARVSTYLRNTALPERRKIYEQYACPDVPRNLKPRTGIVH